MRTLWHRLREVFGAVAVLAGVGITTGSTEDWALHIVIFDVGQADAIAMVASDGDAVVIDAGKTVAGAEKIAEFLSDENENGFADVTRAKLGIVTHYDEDHMRGFDFLDREGITFKSVYDQGPSLAREGKARYLDYLEVVGDPGVETDNPFIRKTATIRHKWKVGDAWMKVIGVRGDTREDSTDIDLDPSTKSINENPGSVAVLLELGDFRLYTAGDQTSDDWKREEPDTERRVLNSGALGDDPDIDVDKANHHGSDTSNGREFLQALSPEVSIISSKNTGHDIPKRIAVKQMIDAGSLVYITGDGLDDDDEIPDSAVTDEDDDYEPPEDALLNAVGDVHILVNREGSRYVVYTEDEWREFEADEE